MKRVFILIFCALSFVIGTQSVARDKQTYAMSMKVFKIIESANLLMEENKPAEAIETLTDALEKRASKYEKAQLNYLLGSFYYRQSDEANALVYFEKVIAFKDGMPELLYQQSLKTLVQMHMVQENYAKAREFALILVDVGELPQPDNYALLAQANYKLERWPEALAAANIALSLEMQAGKTPTENTLLLINAVHFEQKSMEEMVGVLELLIKHYPKASYILYLSSVYGQLDQQQKQTVLMESLYENGHLDQGSQLRNLASLYIAEKVPFKGAVLLEKAIESEKVKGTVRNLEMLAQAWRLAAEDDRAIEVLGKAAEISDDGELYLRQAYLQFDKARFKQAERTIMLSMDKGLEAEKKGEAWLLLGMTRFNLKRFSEAIIACENAREFESSKKLAANWIAYISTEEEKYNALLSTE